MLLFDSELITSTVCRQKENWDGFKIYIKKSLNEPQECTLEAVCLLCETEFAVLEAC